MGLRGPAPKPTALKLLEGNPSHRPLNLNEPRPLVGEPTIPAHLNKDARKEWRRLVPILLQMGVLTVADGGQLGNLCVVYSTMSRAQAQLDKSGLLMKTTAGYVQTNPLLKVVATQMAPIGSISREFGLSPASRTRIHAQADNSFDAIWELMCG
jgi:P27 family predicted phage terminase small subunit